MNYTSTGIGMNGKGTFKWLIKKWQLLQQMDHYLMLIK